LFDNEGRVVEVDSNDVSAYPPDINILPGYGDDPRTIDKLVDGTYFTMDDFHVWLAPFTKGNDHTISINLGMVTSISMIRVWNYNKSRIHSFRGARMISIKLDE
jgi:hypothetical protein